MEETTAHTHGKRSTAYTMASKTTSIVGKEPARDQHTGQRGKSRILNLEPISTCQVKPLAWSERSLLGINTGQRGESRILNLEAIPVVSVDGNLEKKKATKAQSSHVPFCYWSLSPHCLTF